MSTMKETFLPATIPSTLSSELVSRTQAGGWGLEPGFHHWTNSHRVGLEFWRVGDLPRGARAFLGAVHLPMSPLASVQVRLGVGRWLWACLLTSVPTGCRVRARGVGEGGGLSPSLG